MNGNQNLEMKLSIASSILAVSLLPLQAVASQLVDLDRSSITFINDGDPTVYISRGDLKFTHNYPLDHWMHEFNKNPIQKKNKQCESEKETQKCPDLGSYAKNWLHQSHGICMIFILA